MFEQIRVILAENLGVEAESITTESRIHEDLGVDSIDLFNLIDIFEEALGVRIGENLSIKTVADMVSAIESSPEVGSQTA